ncbi:hypothetical protein K457DRAFT_356825 [Linnemannia elongata AG-77]|uniref:Helicase ATP-binding domain-containing protein n=1 Tax=Linnemannia elongata AG-77 TaxID=1314771 RepID=A0A197JCS6_9FUNG|nr:hypothetical protein K457DRAFT_356825 [Linnemannia elongata AG-77]
MSYPTTDIQRTIVDKLEFNDLRNQEGLYPHQEFVRRYLSPYTPYRGILLFHALGSGKSLVCISIALDHYLHDGKRCLIVTKGGSGTESFKKQVALYYTMAKPRLSWKEYSRIFSMDHYLSLHNSLRMMTDASITARYSSHILVFDEIHNARQKNLDVTKVYNSLERLIRVTTNTKILLVTATPMTNEVSQLDSIVRLITDDGSDKLDGIVSYNSRVEYQPKKIVHGRHGYLNNIKVYPSTMISHQRLYHQIEENRGPPEDIYKTLTHISLFTFPGENNQGIYGRNIYTSGIMYSTKEERRITSMTTSTSRVIKYVTYHVEESYRKWLTGDNLRKCSSKYHKLIEILESPLNQGPVFVFVEEVRGSGLLLLANILEMYGYELYVGDHLGTIRPRKRYTICVGDQSMVPNMEDRLEGFNHEKNMHGEYVNILLGSKVIGESITMLNVRMFHVMTVHWNDSTVDQAVGRVVRSGSHDALPPEDRTVHIYIHAAIYKDDQGNKHGTDLYKFGICNRKQVEISRMEKILRKVAVDRYMNPHEKDLAKLDPSTFLMYYMDRFQEYLWEHLNKALTNTGNIQLGPIGIQDVIHAMSSIHPTIAMELVYRAVTTNKLIYGRYMREGNGKLHLVRDPTTPFFSVYNPNAESLVVEYKTMVSIKATVAPFDKKAAKNLVGLEPDRKVEYLRNMPYMDRVSLVEGIVSRGMDPDVDRMFKALFVNHGGHLYHIMCYRIPGDAYTAVLPIPKPKILQNKTRILENGRWRYVDALDTYSEQQIVSAMDIQYTHMMDRIDRKEDMYLIISLIDNKPRLRTRIFEKTNKGDEDKRFIRKGRCLSSILRANLSLLYSYVASHIVHRKYITEMDHTVDMSVYDKHVDTYGYKSVDHMKKKDPRMYCALVQATGKNKSRDLVREIESMMVGIGKYVFL